MTVFLFLQNHISYFFQYYGYEMLIPWALVPASSKSIQKGSTTTSWNRKIIWQDFSLRPLPLLSITMQSWCFKGWTGGVGSCSTHCQGFSQIFIFISFSESRLGISWCLRAGIFSLSWPHVSTHSEAWIHMGSSLPSPLHGEDQNAPGHAHMFP